jgi:hypothetical protein
MDNSGSSNLNPVALVFLAIMGVVILRGRRTAAVKALMAIAAFMPLGQQMVIFGLHFTFLRILILIGACRVLAQGEARNFQWLGQDKLFLAWALVGLVFGLIRSPSAELFGMAYNSIGIYFIIRCLTRDALEILEHLQFLAVVAVIIALAMSWEVITHKNLFYVFGGVPQFVGERDGRFRCQGPFRHPILAGTFAATVFPLMIGLWLQGGRKKWLAFAGLAGATFSTFVAASSGAILTCLTALVGFALWPMRFRMHLIRRGIVAVIVVLSLVMKAPVWYLIAKLSDLLGGTGWHRSYLIDQAVNHFDEWWLIGSSYTAHWAPGGQVLPADPNNMDITNHYIAQGLHGGVLELGLFIAIITACFKTVGRCLRSGENDLFRPKLVWALGVCLAAHCTALISISYFDQIEVFWFWLWAVIPTLKTLQPDGVLADQTAIPAGTESIESENPAETKEAVFQSS